MHEFSSYGLWSLVALNSAIMILFAFSFVKPRTRTDWRSLGAFSAFIVALFAEMYGFPLTIYLLSGWLIEAYPEIDVLSHDNGHLWHLLSGSEGDPHWAPLHLLSMLMIITGFLLLANAWHTLHKAQQSNDIATTGAYQYCRHPQYLAFIIIMTGFLIQWPTLPTLLMFPVLVWVYRKLALREEQFSLVSFGQRYRDYMASTPAWLPRLR